MSKAVKICAYALGISMLLSNVSHGAEVILPEKAGIEEVEVEKNMAKDMVAGDIALLEEMLPTKKEDLSKDVQYRIEHTVVLAKSNPILAAEHLNEIVDENIYETTLNEILDSYYGEDNTDNVEQIKEFTEAVDNRADETLANYAEAKAERDKQSELEYETGEVIAVFKAGVTDEQIAEIAGYVGKDYDMISTFEIDETLPENKLERLKSVGNQEFPKVVSIHIDLDKTVSRAEEILDTLFSVKATSENSTNIKTADIFTDLGVDDEDVDYQEEFLRQIKVPTAWKSWNESGYDITYSQVSVAVIDTGLDITHPDLKNMYSKEKSATIGHNGVSSIEKMDATNCYWRAADNADHGTHVAGIIAAQSNNKIGGVGVASIYDKIYDCNHSFCEIIAINASLLYKNEDGKEECRFNDKTLATAIYYAVGQGADIINMSLGGPDKDASVEEAINYAHANNVIICAAAGNGEYDDNENIIPESLNVLNYPASYSHVVSVANVDEFNQRWKSSVYNGAVDLAAPGVDIFSCAFDKGYLMQTGTSMSTPMVSAGMAMLRAIHPTATADQIETIMNKTATDLYTAGRDIYTGFGLINLELAVQTAKAERLDVTYPQNIHVGRASYQSIRIKWDPVEWAERYVIFRSTSANGTYTKIQSIRSRDGDQLTDTNGRYQYVDAGLDTGSTYYYKIRAACTYKDGFRFSEYCPVANAKCTLDTPTGLTLIPTVGKMTFSWKKVNGANGYLISKATSKNGTFTRIKEITNGSTLSFVDTAVTAGKTYYYRMRAYRTVNGKKVISNLTEIVSKQAK